MLDIETAIDRTAAALSGHDGPRAFTRPWLHRVVAVSTLFFVRAGSGFEHFQLQTTSSEDPEEEVAVLEFVERRLAELGDDGLLLTWNGTAHDLPVLTQRRFRHWLFGHSRLHDFEDRDRDRHVDLMRSFCVEPGRRWPALCDVCACVGIPCDGRTVERATACGRSQAKGQIDVIATFLVYCFYLAQVEQTEAPLALGWTSLADYLLDQAPTAPHLTQFATAPAALRARHRANTITA